MSSAKLFQSKGESTFNNIIHQTLVSSQSATATLDLNGIVKKDEFKKELEDTTQTINDSILSVVARVDTLDNIVNNDEIVTISKLNESISENVNYVKEIIKDLGDNLKSEIGKLKDNNLQLSSVTYNCTINLLIIKLFQEESVFKNLLRKYYHYDDLPSEDLRTIAFCLLRNEKESPAYHKLRASDFRTNKNLADASDAARNALFLLLIDGLKLEMVLALQDLKCNDLRQLAELTTSQQTELFRNLKKKKSIDINNEDLSYWQRQAKELMNVVSFFEQNTGS